MLLRLLLLLLAGIVSRDGIDDAVQYMPDNGGWGFVNEFACLLKFTASWGLKEFAKSGGLRFCGFGCCRGCLDFE